MKNPLVLLSKNMKKFRSPLANMFMLLLVSAKQLALPISIGRPLPGAVFGIVKSIEIFVESTLAVKASCPSYSRYSSKTYPSVQSSSGHCKKAQFDSVAGVTVANLEMEASRLLTITCRVEAATETCEATSSGSTWSGIPGERVLVPVTFLESISRSCRDDGCDCGVTASVRTPEIAVMRRRRMILVGFILPERGAREFEKDRGSCFAVRTAVRSKVRILGTQVEDRTIADSLFVFARAHHIETRCH
ncbi:hypothetical protein F5Y15DRAFT_106908 [Xylariaceae sp. FL0016]|nr:hypothetical protein F5Y15DRAFT_106908 [Xylariaceae sp. FL0016]